MSRPTDPDAEASPWPESTRSQALLFGAGATLLLPAALSLSGLLALGGTVVVGTTAVASALLVYALLGWGGNWAARDEAGDPDDPPGG